MHIFNMLIFIIFKDICIIKEVKYNIKIKKINFYFEFKIMIEIFTREVKENNKSKMQNRLAD